MKLILQILLLCLVHSKLGMCFLTELPLTEPTCQASDAGTMFGYSVSLSQPLPDENSTWMAVGKPWDCSVHFYVAVNSLMAMNTSVNASEATAPTVQWFYMGSVSDTKNGTWPIQAYSLFGYSVSLSRDGRYVAVGIPARTTVPINTPNLKLEDHQYSGSVRIYRRKDIGYQKQQVKGQSVYVPIVSWVMMGEVWDPNADGFYDKFGSKVLWQSGTQPNTPEHVTANDENLFLLVGTNGGWDGASVKFYEAEPSSLQWPIGPTTQVSRSGVYVYQMSAVANSKQSDSSPGKTALGMNFMQFLMQKSPAPLGTIGVDFAVLPVTDPNNPTQWTLALLVRDLLRPSTPTPPFDFSGCLNSQCSQFSTFTDPNTQQQVQINSTGVVIEYIYSQTSMFTTSGTVLSASGSDFVSTHWDEMDWFGVGIGAAWDYKFNRYLAAVGAPKGSQGIYTFFKRYASNPALDGTPYGEL